MQNSEWSEEAESTKAFFLLVSILRCFQQDFYSFFIKRIYLFSSIALTIMQFQL